MTGGCKNGEVVPPLPLPLPQHSSSSRVVSNSCATIEVCQLSPTTPGCAPCRRCGARSTPNP
eukprot:5834143-Pyramimonas_sp.AAC.1